MKKISNNFLQRALAIIIFLLIFAGIALKLEKNGPIFLIHVLTCPSLPSIVRENRFQVLDRVLNNKTGDHFTFLGNCPPTPPLSQHFALSEERVLMLS